MMPLAFLTKEPTSNFDILTDKKDNFLINLSFDSKADFLISGDKVVLKQKEFHHTQIVTINDFLKFTT